MDKGIISKIIILLVKKLKNDDSIQLKTVYTNYEFLYILKYRTLQLIRGFFKKLFVKNISGLCFVGRKVKIEYAFLLKAGKSLILEDGVILNALSKNGITLGRNVTIAKNSILQCTGVVANKGVGIRIGNNSAVGAQSYLGGQGGIDIGDDVIMGPGVMIFSENHNYENPDVIIRKQGESRKGVRINDNCWIGAGSKILDGVEIGEGSVVAAGSVVTKSIPSNCIAAGIPAKVIKNRIKN